MDVYPPIDDAERYARQTKDEYLTWRIRRMDEDVDVVTELIESELQNMEMLLRQSNMENTK